MLSLFLGTPDISRGRTRRSREDAATTDAVPLSGRCLWLDPEALKFSHDVHDIGLGEGDHEVKTLLPALFSDVPRMTPRWRSAIQNPSGNRTSGTLEPEGSLPLE